MLGKKGKDLHSISLLIMVTPNNRFISQCLNQNNGICNRPRRSMAVRSYPMPEVRGGGREELPHLQGAVAARAQER